MPNLVAAGRILAKTSPGTAAMIDRMDAAIRYIFKTRRRLDAAPRGLDEYTRDTAPTRRLLARAQLLSARREYIVVTGSRGKGSVTAINAKLLQAAGRRVGMLTSPHLVHWNERIRVDGRMIATGDFLRILRDLQPVIDSEVSALDDHAYLSPQGIFLAIALRHFDEQGVNMAVLEVGRGGRIDDVALVPNRLSLFAPVMLEHTRLLGGSLERIAWHKAGIIKPGGHAISLPQADEVAAVLQREAEKQGASLTLLGEDDLAQLAGQRDDGQLMRLPGGGEFFLPLLGRYQLDNATLAIQAARYYGVDDSAIRRGLADVRWLGRVQQLEHAPGIYIDGAITPRSAQSFVDSLRGRLGAPVVSIVGVPRDRDYAGVYHVMAGISDSLLLTETDINPSTRFPARDAALAAARATGLDVRHAQNLTAALHMARQRTGAGGTILLAGSLMLIGECMLIWQVDTSEI